MFIEENSFKDYLDWLNHGFLKRNGGWTPPELQEWYDTIDKTHKDVRAAINGKIINKKYKLKSIQKALDVNNGPAKEVIDKIEKLIPDFYRAYEYTRDVFQYPATQQGNHNAIKLSKEIARYARDYCRSDTVKEVDKLLSVLGELWSKSRTNECELGVTLSTTARAFTLLGHYGPDNNSCFRQGSTSKFDKYILAQSDNTFVLSVHKFNAKKGKEKNVARAFGWYSDNCFNVRNYYFEEGFQEGDFIELLNILFTDIFGVTATTAEDIAHFRTTEYGNWRFYQNNYGNWSFAKNRKPIAEELSLNYNNILCFVCPHCGREYKNKAYFKEVDGTQVCTHCVENSNVCELSGVRTFSSLQSIISENGDTLDVHENVANKLEKCSQCGQRSVKISTIDDEKVCPECEVVNYSYCEVGHHLVKDDRVTDIGDICVCDKHSKELINSEEFLDILYQTEV